MIAYAVKRFSLEYILDGYVKEVTYLLCLE